MGKQDIGKDHYEIDWLKHSNNLSTPHLLIHPLSIFSQSLPNHM